MLLSLNTCKYLKGRMNRNIFILSFVGVIIISLVSATGISPHFTTAFAQTNTNTSPNATSISPITSFADPAGYAIGKKHVYDAPLLDVHFYCSGDSGGIMATCLIFNGNKTGSALIGVEYIISAEQYASLPEREKPNWSPISEEEESEIRYPNLTPQQLQQVLEQFKDSYVKLILTWNPNDNLPQYPPQVVIESLVGGGEGQEHKEILSNETSSQ
jgi:hypothetical protein